MTSIKQEATILKYHKHKHLNIGIVIFGILFLYLIGTIIMYLLAPRITVYEVRQGSILKDNAYTGLVLREETVIYAQEAGYVNFYLEESSKLRVGANAYALSDTELNFKEVSSDKEFSLTQEEFRTFVYKIQGYNEQYSKSDFDNIYSFKTDFQHGLNKIASQSKSEQLAEFSELNVVTAEKDGIIVYTVDGMESLDTDSVSLKQLGKEDYQKTDIESNSYIESGAPVYKVVTDNKWNILIEVTEETQEILAEKKTVKVKMKKDNQEIRANIRFLENSEKPVACLSFQDSMIRYVHDRYLDIELILEDETGLKIPKTAETTKYFYVVPKSYITLGGNSNQEGVMRKTQNVKGETITEFFPVTVYYEEEGMVYLDPNVFEKNDVLIKTDSMETFHLDEKRSLKGVFCINKGYAVFKQIQILCESDEYYIVEEGNDFGLSNYDHIALNSHNIKENDVVF